MKLRVTLWAILFGYVALLVTLTHLPQPPNTFDSVSDKKLHFAAYFVLATLAFTCAAVTYPKQRGLMSIIAFLGGVFGALDESTQPLFRRHADVHDWGADMLGVLTAVWVCGVVRRIIERVASRTPHAAAS